MVILMFFEEITVHLVLKQTIVCLRTSLSRRSSNVWPDRDAMMIKPIIVIIPANIEIINLIIVSTLLALKHRRHFDSRAIGR